MKIQGKKVEGANVEICVIPRGNGEDIVFKCQAVLSMDGFDKLCPSPKAPLMLKAGGKRIADIESPKYKVASATHSDKRMAYIVLKSLEATPDLEWETVKLSDPETWLGYQNELKESGFSTIEIMRIINACMAANCLDEGRIERAREDFLATQQVGDNGKSIPEEEQSSTVHGGLVSE